MDKWLYNRECRENSLSRDEVYEIFVSQNATFPGKRADDLFFRSNSDGDNTISCDEFVDIYMKELDELEQKRLKHAENIVRLKGRISSGVFSFITRLFKKDPEKFSN